MQPLSQECYHVIVYKIMTDIMVVMRKTANILNSGDLTTDAIFFCAR